MFFFIFSRVLKQIQDVCVGFWLERRGFWWGGDEIHFCLFFEVIFVIKFGQILVIGTGGFLYFFLVIFDVLPY